MILILLIDSTSDQLLGKQQIPVMMSSYHTEPVARFRQLKLEQSTDVGGGGGRLKSSPAIDLLLSLFLLPSPLPVREERVVAEG